MKKLTIFTATYNREDKIKDAYNSLIAQTNKDFIWLVVDDGSSDNTQELFEKLKKDNIIEIHYYKKDNGGKHSAINYGLDKVSTEYVYLSLDSDDILFSNDTVHEILKNLNNVQNDQIGIVTLCTTDKNGNNDLNAFIECYDIGELKNKTLSSAYKENLINAECRMILKTDYVKKFKYPEIINEKFFTEAYTYWQMDNKVLWTNLNTCYSEYLSDGLTANSTNLFLKNPTSWYLYNELRLKNTKVLYLKLKFYIYYMSFGIMSKNKLFKSGINWFLLIVLYPVALLGVAYLKSKGRKK